MGLRGSPQRRQVGGLNGGLKSSESKGVDGVPAPDPLRGSLMTRPFLGSKALE